MGEKSILLTLGGQSLLNVKGLWPIIDIFVWVKVISHIMIVSAHLYTNKYKNKYQNTLNNSK